jgi:hypothetical protein
MWEFLTRALSVLDLLAAFLLSGLMFRRSLHRRYLAFFVFWIFQGVSGLLFLVLPYGSDLYFNAYIARLPLAWTLWVWLTWEIVSLSLEDRRGLQVVTRRLVLLGAVLALTVAGAMGYGSWEPSGPWLRQFLALVFLLDRTLLLALVLFLALFNAGLLALPLRISPNALSYSAGLAVYFILRLVPIMLASLNLSRQSLEMGNVAFLTGMVLCQIFWMLRLTGERNQAVEPNAPWSPAVQQLLLTRLDALDRQLTGQRPNRRREGQE